MSTNNPLPEEEHPLSAAACMDPGVPSCSSHKVLSAAETAKNSRQKRRRRKKNHHKVYVPGNSKSLRRIKRLGYTPEHNKRGYGVHAPRLNPVAEISEDIGLSGIQITAEYPYPRQPEDDTSGPKRKIFYSYTKVNGKSARYLHETPEEQAARRAKYKERNRKYSLKETEEQHRQRLERRRLRRISERVAAGMTVVNRRRRRSAREIETEQRQKDVRVTASDEERLETLRREYVELDRYVAEKLQESADAKSRQLEIVYWQHDPEQVSSLAAENAHNATAVTCLSQSVGTAIGYLGAVKSPNTVLYSNDPVDPEIALLETSDETFVPVQVIIQTCDDFDDMLEIEENA